MGEKIKMLERPLREAEAELRRANKAFQRTLEKKRLHFQRLIAKVATATEAYTVAK